MKIFSGKMQFGNHHILLEIDDENLIQFVEKEYVTSKPNLHTSDGVSLLIQSSPSGLAYAIRNRGIMKKKVLIPKVSDTPYKEFILQGMIEASLADTGIFFMHASSFIERRELHVFLGPSGSGKTTILKRLDPEKITSNDTLALIRKDDGSMDVIYPSPFDKSTCMDVKAKKLRAHKINFYSLVHAEKNTITPLVLHEQVELLVQNMNKYMFSVQKDVASKANYKKTLQEEAVRLAFFLTKYRIDCLSFNKEITKSQFIRMTQHP